MPEADANISEDSSYQVMVVAKLKFVITRQLLGVASIFV